MQYKLLIILSVFVSSQVEAIPLNEGFEGGVIPENWIVVNNDGDSYKWETYQDPGYAHSGNWCARIYRNTTQNDDWLITPKLIVNSGDTFSLWARSYSSATLEDLNILVSTTSPTLPSFTDTLDTLKGIPNSYTQYVYLLDAYVGQNIYIAIQCVSQNKQYLFVDDVLGPEMVLPNNDMGVDTILSPREGDSIPGDTLYPIKVIIKNWGSVTQFGIPVILKITGSAGGYSYADTTQTDSLEYDSTQQIIFNWLTPEINTVCTLRVWTSLSGDENPFNDTAKVRVRVYRKGFHEGFEGGVIPSNWTVIDNDGDGTRWKAINSPTYAHSGSWLAYVFYNTVQTDDWLITPKLEVDSGDVFSFWARSYSSPEDFNVRLSTGECVISAFTDTLDTVRNIPTTYSQFSYPLDEYAGRKVFIAVQYISQNHDYLFVDDFAGPPLFFPHNEMGVDTIYEPGEGAYIEGDTLQQVKARVKNYGEFTQSNIPVILKISGSFGYSYSDTQQTGTLVQYATQTMTFDWLTPDVAGMACTLQVWSSLSTDEDPGNDTSKVRVTVYRKGGLFESFETDSIPDTWRVIDNNGNGFKWVAANAPSLACSGNWFAVVHYSGTANDDWLITPRLAVDSGDVFLFWARSRSAGYPEAFNVRISRTVPQIDSFVDTLGMVTNVPTTYTQYIYSLGSYIGDSIYIAVQSTSTAGLYLDVDDFLGPEVLPPGAEERDKIPTRFDISNAFPNPMQKMAVIHYQIPKESEASIKIYNCAGLLVKTLIDKRLTPGYYSVTWDGLDDNGKKVGSGIYFYKLEVPQFSRTRKLILVR